MLQEGKFDLMVAARFDPLPDEVVGWHEPTLWLAGESGLTVPSDPIPLALLDPPCGFRTVALAALERAGRSYRIAVTSQSLSGLKAAVGAGLAVTLRTARSLGPGFTLSPAGLGLPHTEPIAFGLRVRVGANTAVRALADLIADRLPGSILTLAIDQRSGRGAATALESEPAR